MIVVDANILVAVVVASTHSSLAHRVGRMDPQWVFPPLCRYEVTSSLVKLVRAGALTEYQGIAAIADATALVAGREVAVDQVLALRVALALGLSAYDAQYIAVAQAYGIRCVTTDVPLARKAPDSAVLLSEFVGNQ